MIGLVFLRSEDPLEKFISFAFDFPFTCCGFIIEDSSRKIFLLDLFGIYSGSSMNPTNQVVTQTSLEKLYLEPLLEEIEIRWLDLTIASEEVLRIEIAGLLSKLQKPSYCDMLKELVGLKSYVFNTLDALILVLEKIGIHPTPTRSKLPHRNLSFSNDRSGAATFLASLVQPFQTPDFRWQSLTQLGRAEKIKPSRVSPAEKEICLRLALNRSLPIFKELSNTFLTSLTNDDQFMLAALRKYQYQNLLPKLLLESLDLNLKLLELSTTTKTKELKVYQKKLQDLLENVKEIGLLS